MLITLICLLSILHTINNNKKQQQQQSFKVNRNDRTHLLSSYSIFLGLVFFRVISFSSKTVSCDIHTMFIQHPSDVHNSWSVCYSLSQYR